MGKSASKQRHRNSLFAAKGVEATQLRRRKYALVRKFDLSEDLLGGSLSLTHRSCGKPGCHCATDDGHPMWTLTFSVEGKKHVEIVPEELVSSLKPLTGRARELRSGVAELLAINAQLFKLTRREQRARARQR